MQVGLDKQTSTNCKAWPWFRQDKHRRSLVLIFIKIFAINSSPGDGILIPNLHKALYVSTMVGVGEKPGTEPTLYTIGSKT